MYIILKKCKKKKPKGQGGLRLFLSKVGRNGVMRMSG